MGNNEVSAKVFDLIKRFSPLLLPLILFLSGIAAFPYPDPQAAYSDMSLAHFPYTDYLRRSLFQEGRFPLWSPLFFSGSPFAANPLSGLWYLPGWIALVIPLPLGFNLLVMAHLLWGGIGMYRFLRKERLDHLPALFGALAFMGLPKLFAHYGAGHLTLLYAISWTPWLLLASRSAISGNRYWDLLISWEAPILATIFLADPRWAAYAALLWWGYRLLDARPSSLEVVDFGAIHRLARLAIQSILAILLAAPLAVPLVEFTRLTTRAGLKPEEVLVFSLPWVRILGLVIPDFNGFHEYMLYAGQGIALLALLAVIWKSTRRAARFWIWVFVISILYAFGDNLPPLRLFASLPLIGLLRVPSRALFLTGFSLVVLSAYSLHFINKGMEEKEKRQSGLVITAYTGFLTVLTIGFWVLSRKLPGNFAWAVLFAWLAAVSIGLIQAKRIPARIWIIAIFAVCLADWMGVDRTLFSFRPAAWVLSENSSLAESLTDLGAQEESFRVYSPSYSLPQQTAEQYNLQLSDGVDPLHLLSYAEFMEHATGVPITGYSVTLPPFQTGNPSQDNASYLPDPSLLGLFNVRFIASEFDLATEGLVYEGQTGGTRLYRNMKTMPRAWVQPEGLPAGEQARPVKELEWSPERISLHASGPGLLVLSEIVYPGWRVTVDGLPAEMQQVSGLLRAVRLSPGEHDVTFKFHPLSVYVGLLIGLAFWTLSGIGLLWKRKS